MSEWISVHEDTPDTGSLVLAWDGESVFEACYVPAYFHAPGDPRVGYGDVSHWMPLPAPPEPKLNVREALKLAIDNLDRAYQSSRACRQIPIEKWWDWSMSASALLPRLRSALESEE